MTVRVLLLAAALIAAPAVPAAAHRGIGVGPIQILPGDRDDRYRGRRGEQDEAYHGRRAGALLPLRDIESGIVPQMRRRGADYIGAELDGGMSRYRLKFVRDGSVIWVDVDGRTGAVVGRAGD